MGHPPDPGAREGHHLAQPGRPVGVGHRRQRDAALLALVRHRQGVPDGGPARPGGGSARPPMVAPRAVAIMRRLALAGLIVLLAAPAARAADCIVLEDFSRSKLGEFPTDWKPRKESGRGVYSVREEGGRRFLRAVSDGIGIQAAREQPWDVAAYPILAWAWRLQEHPNRSDERNSKTNDSALAVYAVW